MSVYFLLEVAVAVDALVRMRVLRAAGYRCGASLSAGARCSRPASLVTHPAPDGSVPAMAVCRDHAKLARP